MSLISFFFHRLWVIINYLLFCNNYKLENVIILLNLIIEIVFLDLKLIFLPFRNISTLRAIFQLNRSTNEAAILVIRLDLTLVFLSFFFFFFFVTRLPKGVVTTPSKLEIDTPTV